MAKSARKPTPSTIVNRTVPRRGPNSELRPREYLTEKEIERLQETARKRSRYGHRDATMILIAYRHGLRASELCGLRWDQIDLNSGRLHVRRAKGGIDNVHPLSGKEIRALLGQDFHLVGPLPMQRWPSGDEGFTARWHHAVDFPGADYVQMARGEGGKEPPLACPPNQGFAAHLSTRCFISCPWPPIRTADAATCNRLILGRTSNSR